MTHTLLDIVTYGSYMRIAAPVIPLGILLYSLYQSLKFGVIPAVPGLFLIFYTAIDAASIPINIAYLLWTQVSDSELVSNLND